MEAKEKKGFLLMIYIFCIIIMLFGITFSYFTARARSKNNALDVKSGHLSLGLEVASKYTGYSLIPLNDSDVMKAYHNKCLDDNGMGACSAYDIIVTNDSARQDVVGSINFDIEHISNLSYLVLDEEENVYQNITKIEKSTNNMPLGSNFILESALETGIPTKKKFTLIIWLSNFDYNQVEDRGGNFTASISYNSIYGQKLSSTVSGTEKGDN